MAIQQHIHLHEGPGGPFESAAIYDDAAGLQPGLLLAIEPWVMRDTDELVTDDDGWTLRSATGCRTAHSEHTIAITERGVEVLTPHQ